MLKNLLFFVLGGIISMLFTGYVLIKHANTSIQYKRIDAKIGQINIGKSLLLIEDDNIRNCFIKNLIFGNAEDLKVDKRYLLKLNPSSEVLYYKDVIDEALNALPSSTLLSCGDKNVDQ